MSTLKVLCFLINLIILCSCSSQPSEASIKTAIAQTQVSQPTNTAISPTATVKPIALKDLKLDAIAFLTGDLPSEFTISGDANFQPKTIQEVDRNLLINAVQIYFLHNGEAGGSVTIGIFNSVFERNKVYDNQKSRDKFLGDKSVFSEVPNIGEKAYSEVRTAKDGLPDSINVTFVRCTTIVKIALARNVKERDAFEYAKKLDERLILFVCQ